MTCIVDLFCDDTVSTFLNNNVILIFFFQSKNFTLPYIPPCLQHSILVFGPCSLFWLLFPILFFQCYRSWTAKRFLPLPFSPLFVAKAVITGILLIDSVFIFTRYFADKSDGLPTPTINIIYPIFLIVTTVSL